MRRSDPIVVLIACAAADRDATRRALRGLGEIGDIKLLSAVDSEPRRLDYGVRRCGADANYVLCSSDHWVRARTEVAARELRELGVPQAKISVVDFGTDPSCLADMLRNLSGVQTSPPPSGDAEVREEDDPAVTQPWIPSVEQLIARERPHSPAGDDVTRDRPSTGSFVVRSGTRTLARRKPARTRAGLMAVTGLVALGLCGGMAAVGAEAPGESVAVASPEAPASRPTPTPRAAIPAVDVLPTVTAPPEVTAPVPLSVADTDSGAERIHVDSQEPSLHDRIAAALRDRSIRAVDTTIFIAQPLPRLLHFPRAEAYCRHMDVKGIDGWRLPTAGELLEMRSAVNFGKVKLWSSTSGDANSSSRLVLDARKEELLISDRMWSGAQAICVRSN